jgi:D-alanine-D-alanine ligase
VTLEVLVTFDAELARRTQLHDASHPVKAGDAFFDDVGDARPVAAALASAGHRVRTLGLDRRAAEQLAGALGGVQLVFNLCDTLGGESRLAPLVPALLEARGVPVVGADQFGLAVSKRKHDVKALLDRERLPTPRYQVIDTASELQSFALTLEAPVILKLTVEHSSIGLDSTSVCFTLDEVKARARLLLERHHQPVLLEEYVHGREFYVSFYGDPLVAAPMMEHRFDELPEGFLPIRTFDVKWFNDTTRPVKDPRWALPVPLREPSTPWRGALSDIAQLCQRAFEVSGGRDWGRVDLRLDRGGVPMIIDVTPNTYLGPSAPCAKAALEAGLSYAQLINAIADGAWRRHG